MECQILFYVKNRKKITNLSSAEFALRVVMAEVPNKFEADNIQKILSE